MQLNRFLVVITLACAGFAQAQSSSYAGEQRRPIKALSEREVADLLSGQGMGLAKAAELNGYPGPAHVLELADKLGLTAAQREASQALMSRHKSRARSMGAALVEAERALDAAYANRSIDETLLERLTAEIGRQQAALRAEHLRTHLQQTALLTPEQIAHYARLRGYASHGGKHH
jgi:Spy/CpxP family protein refolding chaperone